MIDGSWDKCIFIHEKYGENFIKKILTNLFIIFLDTDYLAMNFISLDSPHFILGWHIVYKARSLTAELKLWFLYP